MAEFTDTLNTPGDYKRAVGGNGGAVDVFGPIADLAGMVFGGRKASNSDSGLADIKNIRDLRADQALDEAAIMTSALLTGDSRNLETLLGEQGQPYIAEMKRLKGLKDAEAIDPKQYDVYLNNVLMDVQAKYPDAADELGKWFSDNKFDHAIGREWKAREAAATAQLAVENAVDAEMYKIGISFQTTLGLSAETMSTMTYRDWVNKGIEVTNTQNRAKLNNEAFVRSQAELEAAAKLSTAEQEAAKVRFKKVSESVVQDHLSSADPGLQLIMEDASSLSRTITETGGDTAMSKKFTEATQVWYQNIDLWEGQTLATARAQGVPEENLAPIKDQALRVRKFIESWSTGPASAGAAVARQLDLLKTKYGIEGIQAVDGLTSLKESLGTDIVNKLFDGTLPGFGAADINALRDQMIGLINAKNNNVKDATARMLDFQRALNSPDIPSDVDPKKLQAAVLAKSVGLASSVQELNAGRWSNTTASHFINGSKGLMKVVGDALGPTITPESMDKAVLTLFTANWRGAWRESKTLGISPEDFKDVGNLSALLAGEALDTIRTANGDKIKFNEQTGRYEPVQIRFATSRGISPVASAFAPPVEMATPPESIKLARQANFLLEHLDFLNQELDFVPEGALKGDGTAEGKMTVRQIFASDEGLAKSLNNWINSQGPSEAMQTAIGQFNKVSESIRSGDRYKSLFNSSVGAGTVSDRMTSATIRGNITTSKISFREMKGIDDYLVGMGRTEGGGQRGNFAHDPTRSSASGTYGFLVGKGDKLGTWDTNLIEVMPEAAKMTDKERAELMNDSVIEDTVMKHFTARNAEILTRARGVPPSWEELNIAHLLGGQGAVDFLKVFEKNPMAKAKDVLPADVVRNNPELTKGTLLYLFNQRTGRGDASFEAYIKDRHGIEFAQVPSQDYFEDFNIDDE